MLGNYYKMYLWSKSVFCCCPIVHASFLQDSIINNSTHILEHFEEIIKLDHDIINRKDPLHGETLLMAAVKANSFDVLKKMVPLKGDLLIKNSYGESFFNMMEFELSESSHQEWKEIIEILEANPIKTYSEARVWKEQPMTKGVRKNLKVYGRTSTPMYVF